MADTPADILSPDFEWLAAQQASEYPFASLLALSSLRFNDVFADIRVSLLATTSAVHFARDLAMTGFQHSGNPSNPYTIIIKTTAAAPIFDSSTWDNSLVKITDVDGWRTISYLAKPISDDINQVAATFILNLAYLAAVFPDNTRLGSSFVAPLVARTTATRVRHVNRIFVNGTPFTGPVAFQAGYNASIVPDTANRLRLNLAPGLGLGRYIQCAEQGNPDILTINGVGPDANGDLKLDATDCYWVERPTSSSSLLPYAYTLHNDCVACPDCESFNTAYKTLQQLWGRARGIQEQIIDLSGQYEAALTRLQNYMAARKTNLPRLELVVTPRYGWTSAVQMTILVGDTPAVSASLTITYGGATATPVFNSGYARVPNTATRPIPGFTGAAVATAQRMEAGSANVYTWDLSHPGNTTPGTMFTVTVTGTITLADGTVKTVSAAKVAPVLGPLNKS